MRTIDESILISHCCFVSLFSSVLNLRNLEEFIHNIRIIILTITEILVRVIKVIIYSFVLRQDGYNTAVRVYGTFGTIEGTHVNLY